MRESHLPFRFRAKQRPAFTLVELLVTVAIIATLISLLLPAIRGAMSAARTHQCLAHQRKLAMDFTVFADKRFSADWGDDRDAGGFRLATFIESQHGIDEFWQSDMARSESVLDQNHIMQCAEVSSVQTIGPLPCDSGGLRDPNAISFALNFRLVKNDDRRPMFGSFRLSEHILTSSRVPLAFDLNGPEAVSKGVTVDATYGAPSLDTSGIMGGDRYWSPSKRHSGKTNVSLIDGSVHSTDDPLSNSWRWDYQPPR